MLYLKNIVLSGGSTLTHNFNERLQNSIQNLIDTRLRLFLFIPINTNIFYIFYNILINNSKINLIINSKIIIFR